MLRDGKVLGERTKRQRVGIGVRGVKGESWVIRMGVGRFVMWMGEGRASRMGEVWMRVGLGEVWVKDEDREGGKSPICCSDLASAGGKPWAKVPGCLGWGMGGERDTDCE